MIFKAIADVEVVKKVSPKGYDYQVLQITFENGAVVVIHGDDKSMLRVIWAMNEK